MLVHSRRFRGCSGLYVGRRLEIGAAVGLADDDADWSLSSSALHWPIHLWVLLRGSLPAAGVLLVFPPVILVLGHGVVVRSWGRRGRVGSEHRERV